MAVVWLLGCINNYNMEIQGVNSTQRSALYRVDELLFHFFWSYMYSELEKHAARSNYV